MEGPNTRRDAGERDDRHAKPCSAKSGFQPLVNDPLTRAHLPWHGPRRADSSVGPAGAAEASPSIDVESAVGPAQGGAPRRPSRLARAQKAAA